MVNNIFFVIGYLFSILVYYIIIGSNPYSSDLYIGKKGAGKTTLLTRLAYKFIKKGWAVFSTIPIPGTCLISPSDIGVVKFPPNSVIMVDEAGLIWNNRNWKNLGMQVIRFMKMCRHERNKLILFTQSNNEIDVTFMRICDRLGLVKNFANCIGIVKHLRYKQVLIPASATAEARITDDIVPISIFLGGLSIYWMPRYWQYFDSFDNQLDLVEKEFKLTPYPLGVKPVEPVSVKRDRKKLKKKQKKLLRRQKIRNLFKKR